MKSGRTKIAIACMLAVVLFVVAGVLFLRLHHERVGPLQITPKRYGRTLEGNPVGWLIVSNRLSTTVEVLGDLDPVSTAFCEYQQEVEGAEVRRAICLEVLSGLMSLQADAQMPVRVFLPTDCLPVRVKLLAFVQENSVISKTLRPVATRALSSAISFAP